MKRTLSRTIHSALPLMALTFLSLAHGSSNATLAQEVKPGEQVHHVSKVTVGDEEVEISYLLYVPENYDADTPMPLMMFLHGAGERGDNIDLVKKWGPPKIAESDKDFPFILVSPQCPSETFWNPDEMAHLVDMLSDELAVDKERMYITGLSMGGYGTWSILAEHPNLFAAAIPICGGGRPETAKEFAHVPVWAFHGDADRVVPPEQSRRVVEALKELDAPIRYTEYEGVGHNSWSETYANEEIYSWLLEQRRSK